MKLRLFGPGGRVWRLAFRIKHTAKSLKYRQLYNIEDTSCQLEGFPESILAQRWHKPMGILF